MRLDVACSNIVDCEHKTAPIDEAGEYFAVGTPAMRDDRINYAEARRISRETFEAWTRRLSPRAGDLLFAREAPVGPVVRLPDVANVAPGQRTVLLRPDPNVVHSAFLYYALTAPAARAGLIVKAEGSTVHHLNVPDIRSFEVWVPSLPEQKAIVEVLGALDDKIAANTALAATAEATIATAYIAAIRGDAAERPLLDELVIEFGEPFGGAQFSEPGLGRPLIRIRDLKTFKSQVWSTESRPREVVVTAGDVLVGMDAEFRATPWLGEAGLLNQRVLRARHATFGRALVREMLRRPLAEVEGEKSATTVIHLNKADLVRKTVDVPNADSLIAFERLAEPLYEARVALANENRTLAATRDALLPQLMSGKLRVRDAEDLIVQAGV